MICPPPSGLTFAREISNLAGQLASEGCARSNTTELHRTPHHFVLEALDLPILLLNHPSLVGHGSNELSRSNIFLRQHTQPLDHTSLFSAIRIRLQ